MISTLFGAIGVGYFVYGRKQQSYIPLIVGVALCVYPYLVDHVGASIAIGLGLVATPWLLR